jgi:predicted nucleic acid-binding protein
MGRLMRRDTINPRELDWAVIVSVAENEIEALLPNRLGIGERAVIAYAQSSWTVSSSNPAASGSAT